MTCWASMVRAGPAMSAQQLPHALDRVPAVERLTDQRPDPASSTLAHGKPVRHRPFAQLGLRPSPLRRALASPATPGPFDLSAVPVGPASLTLPRYR